MALVTMPTTGIRNIDWTHTQPAQETRSAYNGATKILLLPGDRYSATIEVAPRNRAGFLPWRAFAAALRGRANTFTLPVIKPNEQGAGGSLVVFVDGAGQTGPSINLKGMTPSVTMLPAGAMLHIATTIDNQRPFVLTAPLVSDAAGKGAAALGRPLRTIYADNAGVELRTPAAHMRLVGNDTGWANMIAVWQPFSFTCEEAF